MARRPEVAVWMRNGNGHTVDVFADLSPEAQIALGESIKRTGIKRQTIRHCGETIGREERNMRSIREDLDKFFNKR